MRLQLSRSPAPERAGSTVYRARALTVARMGSTFYLSCGPSQLRVTPGRPEATCFLAPDFFDHSPFEQREFFLLALLMLLRPHGLYGLHACALERDGVGLLIAGASGSGKTTTSLELIRRGWRYLSDDAVLLGVLADASVQASAFRRGFSYMPETLARFPELTGDLEFGGEFGDPDGKRVAYPPPSFGGSAATCTPSLAGLSGRDRRAQDYLTAPFSGAMPCSALPAERRHHDRHGGVAAAAGAAEHPCQPGAKL